LKGLSFYTLSLNTNRFSLKEWSSNKGKDRKEKREEMKGKRILQLCARLEPKGKYTRFLASTIIGNPPRRTQNEFRSK